MAIRAPIPKIKKLPTHETQNLKQTHPYSGKKILKYTVLEYITQKLYYCRSST